MMYKWPLFTKLFAFWILIEQMICARCFWINFPAFRHTSSITICVAFYCAICAFCIFLGLFFDLGVHDLMQENILETTLYLSSLASAAHERIIASIDTFGDFVLYFCCTASVLSISINFFHILVHSYV